MNTPHAAPLVSIAVATYRSDLQLLRVALGSALDQTHRRVEVLVGDDSPDDELRAVVEGFDDQRLHYHRNLPALGVAANHEAIISRARGQFIAILNHDDWIAPTFVATLVAALLAHPQAALAFCDHWLIDDTGRRLEAASIANSRHWGRAGLAAGLHPSWEALVVAQSVPIAMGTVIRRSALRAIPVDAGPAYDLWLSYLLCSSGGGAWYEPARLSAWRTHAGNLTSQAGLDWLRGAARCWEEALHDPAFAPHADAVRRKLALGYYSCATRSWRDGRWHDSARYAWRSLRSDPLARVAHTD